MAESSRFEEIKLNLRGTIFYTNSVKFKAFPDSRLAKLTSSTTPRSVNTGEFYFDRNPALFHYILDVYDTGTLHLPSNMCSSMIRRELDYWQLSKEIVGKCCLKTLYKDDEDIRIHEEFDVIFKQYMYENMGLGEPLQVRQRIWNILVKPFSSCIAKIYYATVVTTVLISIVVFSMSTLSTFREPRAKVINVTDSLTTEKVQRLLSTRPNLSLAIADLVTNTILAMDFIIIIYAHPNRLQAIRNWYYVMDLTALLSIYAFHVLDQGQFLSSLSDAHARLLTGWFGAVFCFRILRILRLMSHTKGWVALYMTFASNSSVILFFLAGFFFVCLMSATMMYHAELWSTKSFDNVFSSMWWAVVTLSSVGYGDVVPETVPGQVITVAVIIFGLLLIAIPFVLITSNYGNYYTCYENLLRHMAAEEDKKTISSRITTYGVMEQ